MSPVLATLAGAGKVAAGMEREAKQGTERVQLGRGGRNRGREAAGGSGGNGKDGSYPLTLQHPHHLFSLWACASHRAVLGALWSRRLISFSSEASQSTVCSFLA